MEAKEAENADEQQIHAPERQEKERVLCLVAWGPMRQEPAETGVGIGMTFPAGRNDILLAQGGLRIRNAANRVRSVTVGAFCRMSITQAGTFPMVGFKVCFSNLLMA